MKVEVFTHPEFEKEFKRFRKKYHSLAEDFAVFLEELKADPYKGVSLGKGVHKIRMSVSSKNGGKSGGMRVITYVVNRHDDGTVSLTMLYIYDKSEMDNISDKFISYLLGK